MYLLATLYYRSFVYPDLWNYPWQQIDGPNIMCTSISHKLLYNAPIHILWMCSHLPIKINGSLISIVHTNFRAMLNLALLDKLLVVLFWVLSRNGLYFSHNVQCSRVIKVIKSSRLRKFAWLILRRLKGKSLIWASFVVLGKRTSSS